MNKLMLLLLLLSLMLMPLSMVGQNTFYHDRAVGVDPLSRGLIPVNYGQVRVCQPGAVGSPCNPVASITDIAGNPLTVIGGNFGQLTTDVTGQFSFGCTSGNYLLQVAASSSNTPQLSYMVTCPGVGVAIPAPTIAGTFLEYNGVSTNWFDLYANNNNFTGTNTFPKLIINNGTITNATVTNNAIYVSRTDNSPPVSGAGILNGFLAPMVRLDLIEQSGDVTGSGQVLLLNQPAVKGKSYSHLTAPVVGNGVAQTVTVDDSSIFNTTDRNQCIIDFNHTGSSETVTITAIPDGTHVTGIFTLNHSNNALMHVAGFAGTKSTLGLALSDQAGSTNDLNIENPNLICYAQSPAICNSVEEDIQNFTGIRPAAYYGEDLIHRYIVGHTIDMYDGDGTQGLTIGTGDGVGGFNDGLSITGAKNNGIVIYKTSAVNPTNAINIGTSGDTAIKIGANQPAPNNPSWVMGNPLDAIYLTAQIAAAGARSQTLAFESYDSVPTQHIWYMDAAGGNLFWTLDTRTTDVTLQNFIGADHFFNAPVNAGYRLRKADSTTVAQFWWNGVNAFLQPSGGNPLTVDATNLQVDTQVVADGGGLKHKRFSGVLGGSCPTAAAIGATCTSAALSWTTAFTNANYTVTCSLDGAMTGQPHIVAITNKLAASITLQIAADTAAATNVAAAGFVDCIVMHD